MIGNDIVDLKYSSTGWVRPRFLDKVFTLKEQALIFSSEHQHQTVWLLWSMKEAAYKIHVRQFGERFFNPTRLVCDLISKEKGLVRIDDNCYFTESTVTEDYVYTVAKQDQNQEVCTSIFETKKEEYTIQSNVLKQQLLKSISQIEKIDRDVLSIKKTDLGIPEVFVNSVKLPKPISLTHCGRFSGFAYA
ncbi:4'-phosphopantetheinyl transferase family protein [Psychroserpens burtonensis]|uniref:4'-phosphopantetheinyl transferase family protein n=1 Tax=Psychroserpens burtonensis TaxID=49278 RepID=UPI0004088039|nr:4'-phosphopantetheinyl transferase superfamily protein [Psychroserpens burtonensis]